MVVILGEKKVDFAVVIQVPAMNGLDASLGRNINVQAGIIQGSERQVVESPVHDRNDSIVRPLGSFLSVEHPRKEDRQTQAQQTALMGAVHSSIRSLASRIPCACLVMALQKEFEPLAREG